MVAHEAPEVLVPRHGLAEGATVPLVLRCLHRTTKEKPQRVGVNR